MCVEKQPWKAMQAVDSKRMWFAFNVSQLIVSFIFYPLPEVLDPGDEQSQENNSSCECDVGSRRSSAFP